MRTRKAKKVAVSSDFLFEGVTEEQMRRVYSKLNFSRIITVLYKERKAQGLSQQEIAKRTGIPRTTVSKIESGNRNVTIAKIIMIAAALGKIVEIQLRDSKGSRTVRVDAKLTPKRVVVGQQVASPRRVVLRRHPLKVQNGVGSFELHSKGDALERCSAVRF